MLNLDFKITTWQRVEIPTELEETVMEGLTSGRINCSDELYSYLDSVGVDTDSIGTPDINPRMCCQMSVEANLGASTIQAISSEDSTPLWQNSYF